MSFDNVHHLFIYFQDLNWWILCNCFFHGKENFDRMTFLQSRNQPICFILSLNLFFIFLGLWSSSIEKLKDFRFSPHPHNKSFPLGRRFIYNVLFNVFNYAWVLTETSSALFQTLSNVLIYMSFCHILIPLIATCTML